MSDQDLGNAAGSGCDDPAVLFARLAEMVYAGDELAALNPMICRTAQLLIDGCDHASLMLRRRRRYDSACATDEVAQHIDDLELRLHEGPCIDAIENDDVFTDSDLTVGSRRWPRLAERVLAETPVRGMAGYRLMVTDDFSGALNLYSDEPGALTQDALTSGAVLAAFVSMALTAAHQRESAATLRAGLASNREIGKAVGLLMAFHEVDDATAFEMLRKASQDLNIKLVDVARQVVEHQNTRPADPPVTAN